MLSFFFGGEASGPLYPPDVDEITEDMFSCEAPHGTSTSSACEDAHAALRRGELPPDAFLINTHGGVQSAVLRRAVGGAGVQRARPSGAAQAEALVYGNGGIFSASAVVGAWAS